VPRESLLPIISNYAKIYPFSAIIPISAKTGDGVDTLISEIIALLPPGPKYYPNDDITDQSEREIAAELIREQILHYTNQEIPHGTAVMIDKYEECKENIHADQSNDEMIKIYASILCERDTHKAILLGKSGQMIKRIGSAARIQIEKMTGCKVYLEIHIKVRSDWKNKQAHLQELGYRKGE
jgi:GTP-binding protein Era